MVPNFIHPKKRKVIIKKIRVGVQLAKKKNEQKGDLVCRHAQKISVGPKTPHRGAAESLTIWK